MASTVENDSSYQYFESLRRYVLSPLSAAQTALVREREEIGAEQRGFERFIERIESIECERPQFRPADEVGGSGSGKFEDVRAAYRETVMDVAHYDDVYDNALREDVEAEFGPEVAAALCPNTDVPFTERTRDLLVAAAERSIDQRDAVLEALDAEEQSLGSAREQVESVVKGLDGARIPQWHVEAFLHQIDEVAADRQAAIRRRQAPGFADGHRLCGYLYEEEPWTYPVLTALGRLRGTVVVREE